ncbi:MAG: tol-pal system protein YbgF [SAR324 cluster bacterium]|nr:tol-pal system protein YbgF [SAR324 cluster bacterium]
MGLRTLLIASIIITLSSCTLADRFNKKSGQNSAPQANQENNPSEGTPVRSPPKISSYELLNQSIGEQQKQLEQLKEGQAEDRAALRQLEQKLLTNFELLERSVSGSLTEMDQYLQKLTVALNQLQTQARQRNTMPSSSEGIASADAASPAGSGIRRQEKSNQESPKKLVENYSLFPAIKKSESAKKTPIPPPAEKQAVKQQLVPLAPPSEDKVVNEIPPSKLVKAEENIRKSDSEKNAEEAFNDPYLVEPENPLKLKKRPQVRKLYDQGLDAMINHKYQEAIQTFQDMLKQFPDDEYSDNAMFWLGHVQFSLNRLDQAEEAFHKVLSQYEHRPTTQGYKTPDAIYMLGKISNSRGDNKKSAYYYTEVIKRFPGSTAASNAEEDLKSLAEKP